MAYVYTAFKRKMAPQKVIKLYCLTVRTVSSDGKMGRDTVCPTFMILYNQDYFKEGTKLTVLTFLPSKPKPLPKEQRY